MEFRTKVELPAKEVNISHSDVLMMWGSCFVESIGNLMARNKFTCDINPFGILYNPISIAESITTVMEDRRYTDNDLRHDNGQWYSLMHHGAFSNENKEVCLKRINRRIEEGHRNLINADWIIITFGTARIYEWKEDGTIVGNCHKLPAKCFDRRLLDTAEIVTAYREIIAQILQANPKAKFLFTVSPIRHIKDGLHGNQLNKGTLLLAIHQLCEEYSCCHYFPSYEIMMDELRDYRFYADDMVHPSSMAVAYIWECLCNSCFTPQTRDFMNRWEEIEKGLAHRPFNPNSDAYHNFMSEILLKTEQLKEKFPYLDIQKETSICHSILKK